MSPHLIPNIILADLPGSHTIVRAFFPGLYSEKCDVHLDLPHLTAVYAALLSAIRFVDLASSVRWCPSYQTAVNKALKGTTKHMQWTTHAVAIENTDAFLRAFEGFLTESNDWASGMVYQVQIQGVKDLYQHNGTPDEADSQLDRLLQPFRTDVGKWWIDVGLEIVLDDKVLQWRTSAQAIVLAHVLRISEPHAERACNLSNQRYHRDMSAHLPDLSGHRVALTRNQGGAAGSLFNQNYGSDKNLTSQKARYGVAKNFTGAQVVQGFPAKVITQMYDMYRDAAGSMACSVRMEHRVPLERERMLFMEPIPVWVLNASLLVFEVEDWWYVHSPLYLLRRPVTDARTRSLRDWRSTRIHGIGGLLAIQNMAPPRARFNLLALTTTVGLLWLANSIHCRPRDNAAGRDVMLSVLPLTDDYDEPHLLILPSTREGHERLRLPFCPNNAVFLKRYVWPPHTDVVRIIWGVSMNDSSFIQYFGLTFTDYFRKKVNSGILPRGGNITRANLPTQKRHTKSHMIEAPDPIEALLALPNFVLPVPGLEERGPDIPRNPDPLFAAEDDAHAATAGESNALRLTRIFNNLASNTLQKCGNSKGGTVTSHSHLTQTERRRLPVEIYQNTRLSDYFTRVQFRYAEGDSWSRACNILFPPKNHQLSSSAQSFYLCEWYTEWKNILAEINDPAELHVIMHAVRGFLNTLAWLPDVETNRIWRYDPHERYTPMGPLHAFGMAPRILMRTRALGPEWGPAPTNLDDIIGGADDDAGDAPHGAQNIIDAQGVVPADLALYERREELEESTSDAEREQQSPAPVPVPFVRRIPPRIAGIPSTRPARARTLRSPFPRHNSRHEEEEESSEGEDDNDNAGELAPRDPAAPLYITPRARLQAMSVELTPEMELEQGVGNALTDAPYQFDTMDDDPNADPDHAWDMTFLRNPNHHTSQSAPAMQEPFDDGDGHLEEYTEMYLQLPDEARDSIFDSVHDDDEKDDYDVVGDDEDYDVGGDDDDYDMVDDDLPVRTLKTPEYFR